MKNIKYCCHFVLFYCFTTTTLIAQNWLWAKDGGNTIWAGTTHVTVNANSNIYCLGGFVDSVTFDNTTYHGWADMQGGNGFIAQYNPSGNFVNVGRISKGNMQSGFSTGSLNHDAEGNIYVTGDMSGSNSFDTIFTGANYNGYLAKFDSNLNGKSVKLAADIVYASAFDSEKNTYLAGAIDKIVSHIDTFTLYNSSANPAFHPKMFLAKFDSDGKCLWVKQSYGATCSIASLSLSQGNLYLMGSADSCLQFDTTHICGNNGSGTDFIINADLDGNVKWVLTPGNAGGTYVHSLTSDANGNCYVTGGFNQSIILGNDTLQKIPGSKSNAFLVKYDSTGSALWAKQLNSDSIIYGTSQSSDGVGATYIFGKFIRSAIFENDTIESLLNNNMFIARYGPNGDYLGHKIISNVLGTSIAQDADGNAIVTGNLSTGTTYFDSIPLTCTGQSNFFLAKLEAITGASNSVRMMRLDDRLVIYANPNTGSFTIEVPQGIVRGNRAQLGIYNSTGGMVKDEMVDISNNRLSIDIGSVQKGIYSVTLSSGQKRYTGRVIIN